MPELAPSILVVDDDRDTREVLQRHLERQGYHAVEAANGWEALIALDNHHIDLILLDVMMPGMDGMTFLRILRNAQRTMPLPVVLVTALAPQDAQSRLRTLGLGVDDILNKTPQMYEDLLKTVNKLLGPTRERMEQAHN